MSDSVNRTAAEAETTNSGEQKPQRKPVIPVDEQRSRWRNSSAGREYIERSRYAASAPF